MKSAPTPTSRAAFPIVNLQAFRLASRYADRGASDLLHFFDLDISIAEAEELVAAELGGIDDPFDQEALGEAFQIILCAVYAREVIVNAEQFGLSDDIRVIGAARQVHA